MTVDLRSDTVTKPCKAMLQAMCEAPLGDDVLGDDPTVIKLESEVAQLAGMEAAVFMPSGTMANLVAIAVQTRPGDEVILHEDAHPIHYETGGAAAVAGIQFKGLPGKNGQIETAAMVEAIRPGQPWYPHTSMVCFEDTSNRGGGSVYPLGRLQDLTKVAKARGLRVHMDGARAFHAVVASGIPLATRLAGMDTASLCFSKGLGAPAGTVLCGDQATIAEARRHRKRLGGAMRQAGVLAGAALYALHNNIDRLAEDHARAMTLAKGLLDTGLSVELPETNMLYVNLPDATQAQDLLAEQGVFAIALSPTRMRLVVHKDIDDAQITQAIAGFRSL